MREALWPEGKDKKDALPAALAAAAQTIGTVGTAFRGSFGKKGARVKASSEASRGSVAAHGFLKLPPALVAALAGSDAGALTWLGTANQDFMHFELTKEPALYDASSAGAKGPDGAGAAKP